MTHLSQALRLGLVHFVLAMSFGCSLFDTNQPPFESIQLMEKPRLVAASGLRTTKGAPLQHALQSSWSIMTFGFTKCPDICPANMATLKLLKKDLGERFQYILITVDPKTDQLRQLENYCEFYDPKFIGARGSRENTLALAGTLATTFGTNPKTKKTYHSSKFFIIDNEGRWVGYLSQDMDLPQAAKELMRMQSKEARLW